MSTYVSRRHHSVERSRAADVDTDFGAAFSARSQYTGTCSNAQGEQKASYNAIAYGTDANCAMGSVTGSTAQAQDTSVCVKLSGSALYAKFSSCDVNSAAKALLSFSAVLMMAFAFFAKQL
jgi:hypothetical protein